MSKVEYSSEVQEIATNAWVAMMNERIRPDFWRMFHFEKSVKVLNPDGTYSIYPTDPRKLKGKYRLMQTSDHRYFFVDESGIYVAILGEAVCFSPFSDAHPVILSEQLRDIKVPTLVQ